MFLVLYPSDVMAVFKIRTSLKVQGHSSRVPPTRLVARRELTSTDDEHYVA